MLGAFPQKLAQSGQTAGVIISVALMLFMGFAMTRITKGTAPAGCDGLYPDRNPDWSVLPESDSGVCHFRHGFHFRYRTGLHRVQRRRVFKLSTLKKSGLGVIVITLLEACMASVLVFALTYFVLGLDLAFCAVLAALASATAPASTVMTIRQTGAKGDFVETLLQIVALDDVVSLVAYSIAISIALAGSGSRGSGFETIGKPILVNLFVLVLGGFFGFVL